MSRKPKFGPFGTIDKSRKIFPKIRAAVGAPESQYEIGDLEFDFEVRLMAAIRQRGGFDIVSKITGLPASQLKYYCSGGRFPSAVNCLLIACACDVSLDWLMNAKSYQQPGKWRRKLRRLIAIFKKSDRRRQMKNQHERPPEPWVAIIFSVVMALTWLPLIVKWMFR